MRGGARVGRLKRHVGIVGTGRTREVQPFFFLPTGFYAHRERGAKYGPSSAVRTAGVRSAATIRVRSGEFEVRQSKRVEGGDSPFRGSLVPGRKIGCDVGADRLPQYYITSRDRRQNSRKRRENVADY